MAQICFGGGIADSSIMIGNFRHEHLIPHHLRIEDTVTSPDGQQKDQFLSFARKMLQWLPDDRKTAKKLIEDPWLSDESINMSNA